MAVAKKNMSVIVKRDGANNLRLDIPQTRANIARLMELGDFRELIVRNPYGRKGAPKVAVKATRKPRAKKGTVTA